jgi:exopolysaccharide biosynthesis polyprenyl glycosylphosphotransferase
MSEYRVSYTSYGIGNSAGAFQRAAKRALDVIGAVTAIACLWPLLSIVAIAIALGRPGPILFRQRRSGLNGRTFLIYKFRTMTVLEDGPDVKQACRNDRRVTRIGKILRRASLDELPQLINVLKGDMSLVGPRPHALAHDNKYKAHIRHYGDRYNVKPGLTGWAQINGLRGETESIHKMAKRVEYDIWYVKNWSLSLDVQILWRTGFEVFRDRAY